MKIVVEVSARHIHLNIKDCLVLFDKQELTFRNSLSQKGEFAAEEVVEIVGPKNRLHKVRVLGPLRDKTQLEISRSDAVFLGVDAPLALSGEGIGAEIKIVGPNGSIQKDVAMVAKRHLHLNTTSATKMRVKNGDHLSVKVGGDRATTYENFVVRVSDSFVDRAHLDTDEGNAAGVVTGYPGEVKK